MSATATLDATFPDSGSWFVYLLPLNDCTAFKVGFSCNPFQRIHTFSRRYFEHFDLHRSQLLQLAQCHDARSVEAAIKDELVAAQVESPTWVPREAGGHTEWFSATELTHAEELLAASLAREGAFLGGGADYLRSQLERSRSEFEQWAWAQAQVIGDTRSATRSTRMRLDAARSLRDWLDAYRYFDVPLFADDVAVDQFIRAASIASR
jgi:hypothetical protein